VKATRLIARFPKDGGAVALSIEGERIERIERIDAGDGVDVASLPWISAGLIDLQVNGYAGIDFNAEPLGIDALERLADVQLSLGVTTFVPTLITAGEPQLLARLASIAEARVRSPRLMHMIPFLHVEGPFLSVEDGPRGAHPREHVRAPSLDEVERWQAACDGLVGLVTLSPHWPGSPAFVRALVQRGILVAIGHTHASAQQIVDAANAGAVLSTHLGNGVAATLPRHPNLVWSQLAEDRLSASFIADGHHLPGDTLRAMVRAKGCGRRLLVSDTAALGGMAPGRYEQPIGGAVELADDGRLSLAGTPYLAGAALPLHAGVATLCNDAALSLGDALCMATEAPGRFAGGRGRLNVGALADLVSFDHSPGDSGLQIRQTWLRGERMLGWTSSVSA